MRLFCQIVVMMLVLLQACTLSRASSPSGAPSWYTLTFSPDGRYLAELVGRQNIATYDAHSGNLLGELKLNANVWECDVDTVNFEPRLTLLMDDGRVATSDAAGKAGLHWLTDDGRKAQLTLDRTLENGWLVEYGDDKMSLYLTNVFTGTHYKLALPVPQEFAEGTAMSADASELVVYAHPMYRYRLGAGIWVSHRGPSGFGKFTEITQSRIKTSVAISGDGHRLAAVARDDQIALRVWDANTGHSIVVRNVRPDPDSALPVAIPGAMALSRNGSILVMVYSVIALPRSIAVIKTGKSVGTSLYMEDLVYAYSLPNGQRVAVRDLGKDPSVDSETDIALSPKGDRVAARFGESIFLWNIQTGKSKKLQEVMPIFEKNDRTIMAP